MRTVAGEPKGFDGGATGTILGRGRDGARSSQVFGQAGVRGDGLGGPGFVRAGPMGFDWEATGKRLARGRDGARPSRGGAWGGGRR